jgi:glutamine amidotransferase
MHRSVLVQAGDASFPNSRIGLEMQAHRRQLSSVKSIGEPSEYRIGSHRRTPREAAGIIHGFSFEGSLWLKISAATPTVRLVIALLDYGSGNLRSVEKALRKIGADVKVTTRPEGLDRARGAVLPGVGAFDDCITAMQRQELLEGVREYVASGRAFLGICVGYQALFEKSEEFNSCAAGLGIFQGTVVRFPSKPGLKVPQIGWNKIQLMQPACPLFRDIADGSYVYFVHSFFPQPTDESIIAAQTHYGRTFASAIWRENIFATQFHPEKSQDIGLRLLKNFVEVAEA